MEKKYTITGMSCSACSSGIERAVSKLDGVESCEVNLMSKTMKAKFADDTEGLIISTVKSLGYGIYPYGEEPKKANKDKRIFIRFILSVCLLVLLMYVSMGHMVKLPLPKFLDPKHGNARWFALYQGILSAVILGLNFKFFISGASSLIKKVPNMDTLVSMGSGISFIYSLTLTIFVFIGSSNGNGAWYDFHMQLHFESAATILVLVTVGKWLEEKSKKKTGSEVEKLLRLAPDTVTVEADGEQKTLSLKEVKAGDIIVVKQGEYIPIDGEVIFGNGFADNCAVTGESLPVEVQNGSKVNSASILKSGFIKVRAEHVGDETTLQKIIGLVREAGASKAPIQKFADKVAGIFVPAVSAVALLTFIIWIVIDKSVSFRAVTYAINVLVVSCPCALGLATPVAVTCATGKGARLGILYKNAESLQKASDISAVLLDKTATLTLGKPKVCDYKVFGKDGKTLLKIACGIEKNSSHPIAACVIEYAKEWVEVQNFEYIVGRGARAYFRNKLYLLGNIQLMEGIKIDSEVEKTANELSADGKTVLYLAEEGKVAALIAVADEIKPDSKTAVELLKKRGMKVAMLTGDSALAGGAVAKSLGIDDYLAEVMPKDKLIAVKNVQSVGGRVAMVGDGVNDSPALCAADLGVAMGGGTDVAIDSADVVLMSESLLTLDTVFDLSKAAMRNVKQNLFWAFFYNVIMIPVAAGVFASLGFTFTPMLAALCMSLSSLFVVFNALRLLLYKKRSKK